MLLRILRQWYWTPGDAPQDAEAQAHPLYPARSRNAKGDATARQLWAAVDEAITSPAPSSSPKTD